MMSFIGIAFVFGLFMFAFAWPWIANEIITRKHEKEEEKDLLVDICHCKKCGYIGRISFARYGSYNKILGKCTYDCPKCGEYLWEEAVKRVWRDEEKQEIAKLRKEAHDEKDRV